MTEDKQIQQETKKEDYHKGGFLAAVIISSVAILNIHFPIGSSNPLLALFLWFVVGAVISASISNAIKYLKHEGNYKESTLITVISNFVSISAAILVWTQALIILGGPRIGEASFSSRFLATFLICIIGCLAYICPGFILAILSRAKK